MCRPVRTVTEPARLSRINVRTAVALAILQIRRRYRCPFLPGSTTDSVSGGDLLVEVVVGRHPIFQRQDENIYSTVPMSFAVAALGGEIVIDTVDGKVIYDVKAGTQTDTKVRLKGKGVPSLRNRDIRGDHYVTLVVQVPDKLSHEAKDLLKKFDEETGDTLNAAKNVTSGRAEEPTSGKGRGKKKLWK